MSEFDSVAVLVGRMYSHIAAASYCLIHGLVLSKGITGFLTEGYLYKVSGNITKLSSLPQC